MAVDISQYVAGFGRANPITPGSGIGYGIQELNRQDRNRMANLERQDRTEKRNRLREIAEQEERRDFGVQGAKGVLSAETPEQAQAFFQGWRDEGFRRGYDMEGIPDQLTEDFKYYLAGKAGVALPGAGGQDDPAAIQEKRWAIAQLNNPETPEETKKFLRVQYGLDPRATGSSAITTATTPGLTQQVAGSEASISGAKAGATEEAKLQQRAKYGPAIRSAIKAAEVSAKNRSESLSDYNRAKAAMPELELVVADLKELAPMATYTLAGKFWNQAVKQTGFGATEGATARAKYNAIMLNQVLPLLRQTFGAQFTEKDREALVETMGDPDSTPEEKAAQLDAFITQKYRELETKEREMGGAATGAGPQEYPEGTIIRNPQTGERLIMRGGQWAPVGG